MAVLAGKSGTISLGGTNYAFGEWTADLGADPIDVTTFSSGGYKENIAGLVGAKISAAGPYNQGAMAITAGSSYAFVLTMTTNVTLACTARVFGINVKTDVKDAIRVNITAESTGSFTAAIA